MIPAVSSVTVRPSNRVIGAAVELAQQVVDVGGDEVDERRRGRQRFAVGERAALGDRLGGERGVAAARLGERPRVGRGVGRPPSSPSSRSGLIRRRRDTGCAAPMWVPGAITATSAASAMMKPAEAARAPDGPTKTTTGVRAAIIRDTIVRVESSRPPGVRSTRTVTAAPVVSARAIDLVEELGGDRMDDAVVLGDDRAGWRLGHAAGGAQACDAGEEKQRGEGRHPHAALYPFGVAQLIWRAFFSARSASSIARNTCACGIDVSVRFRTSSTSRSP